MAAGEKGVTGLMKLRRDRLSNGNGDTRDSRSRDLARSSISGQCLTVFGPDDLTGRQVPRRFRTKAAYSAYARHLATQGKTSWAA